MKFQFLQPAKAYVDGVLMGYGIGEIVEVADAPFDVHHPMDSALDYYRRNNLPIALTDGTTIQFVGEPTWRWMA